jgi:hypothetical protein
VKAWLARHPRWTFHFTPTSESRLNAVETFFSALARKRIRLGSFHSLVALQAAIKRYSPSTTPIRSRSFGPRHPPPSWPSWLNAPSESVH